MYIDNISVQVTVFLYSVGFGFFLGFLYDIFKLIRITVIKNNKAVLLQDIVYFILSAFLTYIFLMIINSGRFRLHVFFALVCGFTVYYLTVGRMFIGFSLFILKKIRKLFIVFSAFITAPARLIISAFGKIMKKKPFSLKKPEKNLKNKQKPS